MASEKTLKKKQDAKRNKIRKEQRERSSANQNAPVPRRELKEFMLKTEEALRGLSKEVTEVKRGLVMLKETLVRKNYMTDMDLQMTSNLIRREELKRAVIQLRVGGAKREKIVEFLQAQKIDPESMADVIDAELPIPRQKAPPASPEKKDG